MCVKGQFRIHPKMLTTKYPQGKIEKTNYIEKKKKGSKKRREIITHSSIRNRINPKLPDCLLHGREMRGSDRRCGGHRLRGRVIACVGGVVVGAIRVDRRRPEETGGIKLGSRRGRVLVYGVCVNVLELIRNGVCGVVGVVGVIGLVRRGSIV